MEQTLSALVFIALAFLYVAAWAALIGTIAIAIIRKRFSMKMLLVVATAVCVIGAYAATISGPMVVTE